MNRLAGDSKLHRWGERANEYTYMEGALPLALSRYKLPVCLQLFPHRPFAWQWDHTHVHPVGVARDRASVCCVCARVCLHAEYL